MAIKQENIIMYIIIVLLLIYIVYMVVNMTINKTSESFFSTNEETPQAIYNRGLKFGKSIVVNNYNNTVAALKNSKSNSNSSTWNAAYPLGVIDGLALGVINNSLDLKDYKKQLDYKKCKFYRDRI